MNIRKLLISTTAVPIAIFSFQRGSSGIEVKGLMNSITDSLSIYRKRCHLLLMARLGRRLCGDSIACPAGIARTSVAVQPSQSTTQGPGQSFREGPSQGSGQSPRLDFRGTPIESRRARSPPVRRRARAPAPPVPPRGHAGARSHPAPRLRARARPPAGRAARRPGPAPPAGSPQFPSATQTLRTIPARRARLTGDRRQRTAKAASSSQ